MFTKKGKWSFEDLSAKVQKDLDSYLNIPPVPTPQLPQENIARSQFETKEQFAQRVEQARMDREANIAKTQEQYRMDVEARSSELAKRKASIDSKRAEFTTKHINAYFGRPLIKNLTYDVDSQTAFGEIYSEQSTFNQKISFQIPPQKAKELFEDPNNSKHTVIFAYDKDGELYVKDILIADGYLAHIALR